MRILLFVLSLLLCVNIHAQKKQLVLYRNNAQKDSMCFHKGDYVKVKLTTGKSIHGTLTLIADSFFKIGHDTVRVNEVQMFRYKVRNPNKHGNILIGVGVVLTIGGIALFDSADNTTESNKVALRMLGGMAIGVGGVACIVGGVIKNRGVDRARKMLGANWGLKIE